MSHEAALRELLQAARRVPIVYRDGDGPLTCYGCPATDSEDCAPGCWVQALEEAIEDAAEALKELAPLSSVAEARAYASGFAAAKAIEAYEKARAG